MQSKTYSVLYEKDPEGGYVAMVPALPGCHTQGDTIDEAQENIKEAIELYLESLREGNESLPENPQLLQGNVEVELAES